MKWIKIAAPIVVTSMLLVGWIVALPASWLNWPVARFSHDHWAMANTQGTIWHGVGQPAYYIGEQGVVVQTQFKWDFQPKSLLKGQFTWKLVSDQPHGSISLGWRGWSVQGLGLRMPVAALTELSPQWRSAGLSGWLNIQIAQFSKQNGRYQGGMEIQWSGASSPLSQKQPFGSYRMVLQGEGTRLNGLLSTLEGPLMMEGQGAWLPDKGLQMDIRAYTDPESYTALKPFMLMLGKPSGENAVVWQIKPN